MAEIGDLVATYRLTGLIGEGGMGTVFRAHDERLDREVALKLLSPGPSAEEPFRQRFQRESRVAAAFHHPNIVPVFDAGEWQGQLYIAMMLVEGPNLATVVAREAPMALRRVVAIVSQVASALDVAHSAGIVHRDVKPANILLLDRPAAGRLEHAYLVDFGLTRSTSAMTQMTRVGTFVGTLDYVAPEQLQGDQIDGRADQYALACTTFQMLVGAPPFKRESEVALISAHLYAPPPLLSAVRAGLPEAVSSVLTRAMAKDPSARFRTTEEFAEALSQAAAGVPSQPNTVAAGMAPADAARGTVRSHRSEVPPRSNLSVAVGVGAVLLALVIGLGAVVAIGWPGAQPSATPGSTASQPVAVGPPATTQSSGASPSATDTIQTPTPPLPPPTTPPPFPWTLSVTASATTLQAGEYVDIAAVTNGDVATAGYVIQISNLASSKVFNTCSSGTTCMARGAPDLPRITTYLATVGPAGGPPVAQGTVIVTWLPAPSTPTPVTPRAPELASSTFDVIHTFDYFAYGSSHYDPEIHRTYALLDYTCVSSYDCTAQFRTGSGSTPTYYWNGSTWVSGPTNYIGGGGRKCGDVADGYDVEQTVSVSPAAWDPWGRISEMRGEMVLTGTTTYIGDYYGCSDYQVVYSTVMSAQ